MTFREALDGGLQSAVNWIFVAAIGGVVWLTRQVFTNQKQIDALYSALERRDAERQRDMEEFRSGQRRIEDTQKEMLSDIKTLFRR
jgi:hypothetical protein